MTFRLIHADCIAAMQAMDENSVDAIVTDPPYNLSFMGKTWDRNLNHGLWATEALRVLKPGAHLLAFGGTRTYHRLACAIEDAGFETRDCLAWLYGSGFPKSLDVSKAIDKAAGAEREVVGRHVQAEGAPSRNAMNAAEDGSLGWQYDLIAAATPDAERWQGFGTALKPAHEPIVLARKPLSERNVAANVQRWGTGALNIDGTRIRGASTSNGSGDSSPGDSTVCTCPLPTDARPPRTQDRERPVSPGGSLGDRNGRPPSGPEDGRVHRLPLDSQDGYPSSARSDGEPAQSATVAALESAPRSLDAHTSLDRCASCGRTRSNPSTPYDQYTAPHVEGRWPPNVTMDTEAAAMLDAQTGETTSKRTAGRNGSNVQGVTGIMAPRSEDRPRGHDDTGGASRFLYVAKADREERNRGLGHMAQEYAPDAGYGSIQTPTLDRSTPRENWQPHRAANHHPTVKPVALMSWLCRMVTPPKGTVLDPFTGSGSTGVAALREGFEFIGIEREAEYVEIARARIVGDAPLFNVEADPVTVTPGDET